MHTKTTVFAKEDKATIDFKTVVRFLTQTKNLGKTWAANSGDPAVQVCDVSGEVPETDYPLSR